MTDSVQPVAPTSDPGTDVSLSDALGADAAKAAVPADSSTPPGQSPLDVLDQILKDAQSKAKASIDEKTAEEAAQVAEARARQKRLDEDKVRQQLLGISQVKESPEYHAMQEMQQAVEQKQVDYNTKMDGMQIVQLEHTKI